MVDNMLPPVLARGLGALFVGRHEVVHIKDLFNTGSLPDEEWIERLGREGGWCVLSGDRRIATKRPSRELFLRSNLIGFFLMPAVLDLPLHRQAARILTMWPVMETTSKSMANGCFELGISGNKLKPASR
ncbi:MAG: hypothetical protein PGN16_13730 [Sphingomonas phyllosphaerae]|uniref:PIN-like domain-containing protein n=1 Tax=Sphingomonas phyllosphaerae TaxID=257003 RepID=UPI002FF79F55